MKRIYSISTKEVTMHFCSLISAAKNSYDLNGQAIVRTFSPEWGVRV
jgi:hypothetical protein